MKELEGGHRSEDAVPEAETQVFEISFDQALAALEHGATLFDFPDIENIPIETEITENSHYYQNSCGEQVADYTQRYVNDYEGWAQGELLRTLFVIEHTDEGLVVVPSDRVAPLGGAREKFVLSDLSEREMRQLAKLGIAEFIADVRINEFERVGLGGNDIYSASIVAFLGVQHPFKGDFNRLERGRSVLITGEVTEYKPSLVSKQCVEGRFPREDMALQPVSDQQRASARNKIEVQIANGQTVSIDLTAGYLNFENDRIRHLNPDHPLPGDVVQIIAWPERFFLETGQKQPGISELRAHCLKSTYLQSPGDTRKELLTQSVFEITQFMEKLASEENEAKARTMIGSYVASHLYERRGNVQIDTPKNKLQELKDTFSNNFHSEASQDFPLALALAVNEVNVAVCLNDIYKANIFAMTVEEYTAFAADIAKGNNEHMPSVYAAIYRLLHTYGGSEALDKVISISLESLPESLEWVVDFWQNADKAQHARRSLQNAIAYMPLLPSRKAAALMRSVGDQLFGKSYESSTVASHLQTSLIEAVEYAVNAQAIQVELGEVKGLRNEDAFVHYLSIVTRLVDLVRTIPQSRQAEYLEILAKLETRMNKGMGFAS